MSRNDSYILKSWLHVWGTAQVDLIDIRKDDGSYRPWPIILLEAASYGSDVLGGYPRYL